ncbi:hypothetical protein NDU88_003805 [Pleurodeles waltl]|uniref:Uncharacterized protein n=1 Tax=Pleurodeles waltl TaxID=8319 RepID=A0AAV7SH41_PLEWA|nr:hypothetical protein NDU88_003805 [Pleurodeles waltl]
MARVAIRDSEMGFLHPISDFAGSQIAIWAICDSQKFATSGPKSQLQMVKISSMQNLGEVFQTVVEISNSVCTLQELHIVFDGYLELSVKECERTIRHMYTVGTTDLACIKI